MLGSEHLDQRVVVRLRLPETDSGPTMTDCLGVLSAVDGDHITVTEEDGRERRIPRSGIVAAKVIGPRPTRFSEILDLERILADSWRARENENYAGWTLRAHAGYTRRANSVLALTKPDVDLDEAIAYVEKWYGERGLDPMITASGPVSRHLDGRLAQLGWAKEAEAMVMSGSLRSRPEGEAVLRTEPGEEYFHGLDSARREACRELLLDADSVRFAEVRRGDRTAAWGRGAVIGRTLAVARVGVDAEFRRQGLGGLVMDALENWAESQGADRVALQVETDNVPAIGLYEQRGLRERYRYFYRVRRS
ncbi:GNAT family N-acetyltransferase [Haloglycomyces albus]|uniref:GNAT family N-acetyltransferase n=1 Tax=Haloglycomyces albus TaxID=526067 RepID=UPI00046D22AE|nr:GNAT family N-acetyltransferase [Haloglycomyces albus]